MLNLGLPRMKQTGIVGVHIQVREGEHGCYKIPNNASELKNMYVVWRRLNLAESSAPQTGPVW